MTGSELIRWRQARGLNQGQLTRLLGLRSQGTVSLWESDKTPISPWVPKMLDLLAEREAIKV